MATQIAAGDASSGSRWRLATAGHFAIVNGNNDCDVSLGTRKSRAILAYLGLQSGKRVTRERLATLLWGDRGDAQARASLRQALLEIRHATADGPPLLQSDREHVWIETANLEPESLDETSWARSDERLFDDLDHVSADFDDWLLLVRTERGQRLGNALRSEIEKILDGNRGAAALPLIDRLYRLDLFDEETLRLAFRAEYRAGRAAGIERRFREMESRLQEELGVSISQETRALRDQLVGALRKLDQSSGAAPENHAKAALEQSERNKPSRPWPLINAAILIVVVALAIAANALIEARVPQPKMLAVLPFDGRGGDAQFAEGLSDELISELTRYGRLRVIGRTSASQYNGKAVDLRTVGRQLGAEFLIEGHVAHDGKGLRVQVSLIRASDGTAMWSRIYAASAEQLPLVRGIIGGAIAGALEVPRPAIAIGYRPNSQAYALYLRSMPLFRQRTDASLEAARGLLLEAIRLDPKFAAPWAYVGGTTNLLHEERFRLDATAGDGPSMTPREALQHALRLDPSLAVAHGFLGWTDGAYSEDGYRHLRRAVALDPNNSQILFWYSMALYRYGDYGRYAEVARKAASLDPLWQRSVEAAASASLWAGDDAGVRRYIERIRAGNPDGATEVESSIATQRGDLVKSIQIAIGNGWRPYQVSTEQAATNLMELGFESEGRLLSHSPNKQMLTSREPPTRTRLLKMTAGDPRFDYEPLLWQLRLRGRYEDVAALYDAAKGEMQEVRRSTYTNRGLRSQIGGAVAQGLWKAGRRVEAQDLLRRTLDADQEIRASGPLPPCALVGMAKNYAVAGLRAQSMGLLQRGFAKADCLGLTYNGLVDPMFENLRGAPAFETLVRRHLAHLFAERRQVRAMNLL